jgi:endonuclease I
MLLLPTFENMKAMSRFLVICSTCLVMINALAFAQIPNGYYNASNGLNGAALKTSLHNIIASGHSAIAWTSTWSAFSSTDKKANGKVWDIYSWVPSGAQPYEYAFVSGQCGTYNQEADCFNREHTWPQSFFNQSLPMVTDLHALFPSDGWVNNKRSNFPYGVVSNSTDVFQQGSKLGSGSTYPSYSGLTFEPIDSLKGDIARALLYFSTRYEGEDAGWGNWPMADGANLTADAIALLRTWHAFDPVSSKEIARNDTVYMQQGNRNPFVDFPEFVECIWGGSILCGSVAVKDVQSASTKVSAQVLGSNLHLSAEANQCRFNIINCTGNSVMRATYDTPVNITALSSGLYIIQINMHNHSTSTATIIIP